MPSVYAHYRFGCDVYTLLPEKVKTVVHNYRELYDLGLQGPDILFFYLPVCHNHVNRLGTHIHHQPAREFFQPAVQIIRSRHKKQASMAYICGIACHYALDLVCHPYIVNLVQTQGLNHSAIEGAFERVLIVEDHLPLNTLVTGSICPSPQSAHIIQQFYEGTTAKQIFQALKIMIWCNDGLRMKDNILKKLLFFLLRIVGKYESIAGMVITPAPRPEFSESDLELRRLYEAAKPVAIQLITELLSSVHTGQKLSSQFDSTFLG